MNPWGIVSLVGRGQSHGRSIIWKVAEHALSMTGTSAYLHIPS